MERWTDNNNINGTWGQAIRRGRGTTPETAVLRKLPEHSPYQVSQYELEKEAVLQSCLFALANGHSLSVGSRKTILGGVGGIGEKEREREGLLPT